MPQPQPHKIKIQIPAKQLAKYKRKALATGDEILVALVGHTNAEEIVVEDIYYPPQVLRTPDACSWRITDIVKLQMYILPKQVLGSLHSHPNCTPAVSREDIQTAEAYGESVFGVFSYWRDKPGQRRKTSLDFYIGAQHIELEQAA